ncbi:MAG: outer membrane protein transport protein [Verrucomicrobia bacterium]|nr:outer membrane protein transport protein [Verrucomicrobiota bacterium]MBU1909033.1 outer membrane protein transport protein [Verrucomicrobiota bacterium]
MRCPCCRRFLVLALTLGLLSQAAYGAGFALYEGSARGNAMGGALTGSADDPSALYYNPAGITQLEGVQVMGGLTVIAPATKITTATPMGSVTTETEDNIWIPPHLYATWGVNDRVWLGIGMYSRFGLGTEFDENWPGRYNSYKAVIQTLTFNPNVALKINDQVSLAAGVSAMWLDLDLRRKLPNPVVGGPDLDFQLCGDSIGYGYNVGARWQPLDWLSFGATYQGEVDQDVEGDASVSGRKGDASGDISLPDMVFLGTSVKPTEKFTVEFDAIRTGWSSYDQFALNLDPTVLGPDKTVLVSPKNWDDVWRYAVGVEYALNETWSLRAGYTYDEEPGPDDTADYLLPANDRDLYSVGAGYRWKEWTFDLSYTYLVIKDRTIAARLEQGILPSEFKDGDTHLVGLSVSRKI